MKRIIAALILVPFLSSGCATYQMLRPLDGDPFIAALGEPSIRDAVIDGILIAHPELSRYEAESLARDTFVTYQAEIMSRYRDDVAGNITRAEAAVRLAGFVAGLIRGVV